MRLLLATGFVTLAVFMFSPLMFGVLAGAMRVGRNEALAIIGVLHLGGWAGMYWFCRNRGGRP